MGEQAAPLKSKAKELLETVKGSVEFIAILLAATALILESWSNQRANDLQAAVIELELTDLEHRKAYQDASNAFFKAFDVTLWRSKTDLWATRGGNTITLSAAENGPLVSEIKIGPLLEAQSVLSAYAQALDLCGRAGSCARQFISRDTYGCQVINTAAIGQRIIASIPRLLPTKNDSPKLLTGAARDQDWWRTYGGHIRAFDVQCVPDAKF